MIIRLVAETRNALAQQIQTRLDAAGEGATLKFYTGRQPARASAAISTQTLLGTATFSYPCAGEPSEGVLAFEPITEAPAALADGDVTWARAADADGNTVLDVDVTGPGGGGMIEINSTKIFKGGPIVVSSFTIVIPAG